MAILDENPDAEKEINLAIEKLEGIPQYRNKNRGSYIGICSHPILEDIYRRALNYLRTEHELYFNLPKSYHHIDTFIDLRGSKDLISLDLKLAKEYGIDLDGIKERFIDFTIPSTSRNSQFDKGVLGKLEKYSQDKERLFFTVFYGFYSQKAFQLVEERKDNYIKDKKIEAPENAWYLDVVTLARLFNFEKTFIDELEQMNDLIMRAIMNDNDALRELETLSDEAISRLMRNNKYHNKL